MSGKKRIVAVDDSGIVLKMLSAMLGGSYEFNAFSKGMRAIEFLEQKGADLIILDIDMPVLNGFEVMKMIRTRNGLKDIPVIFLTSNNSKDDVLKAVKMGAKDYAVKPVDEAVLLKKVHALIG